MLTGKYDRSKVEAAPSRTGAHPNKAGADEANADSSARLDGANPFGDMLFTDRNWKIVDALKAVASEIGEPPATVALAWALSRPTVDTVLIGVSSVIQLKDNIGALALHLSVDHLSALNKASKPDLPMIYGLFGDEMRREIVYGGVSVSSR